MKVQLVTIFYLGTDEYHTKDPATEKNFSVFAQPGEEVVLCNPCSRELAERLVTDFPKKFCWVPPGETASEVLTAPDGVSVDETGEVVVDRPLAYLQKIQWVNLKRLARQYGIKVSRTDKRVDLERALLAVLAGKMPDEEEQQEA